MWKEVKESEENKGIHNAKLIMAINRISETLEESNNIFERIEKSLDIIDETLEEMDGNIGVIKEILEEQYEPEE